MAKTIKFNLISDEHPIRTIEELQNNFSVEDVLAYFKSGILERWLDVRGYDKEKKEVAKIDKKLDKFEQISEIIKIFNIEKDSQKIDDAIYNLYYEERRIKDLEKYNKYKYATKTVVNDYFSNYEELVNKIIEDPTNAALIKTNIKAIIEDYENIFNKDFRSLFNRLISTSPLAVLYLLSNEKARLKYLPIIDTITTDGVTKEVSDLTSNPDKNQMYNVIKIQFYDLSYGVIKGVDSKAKEVLNTQLKHYTKNTEGHFYPVEPEGKKIMVIYVSDSVKVMSPAGNYGSNPVGSEINGKFEILDGIQFSSNSSDRNNLYYVEV